MLNSYLLKICNVVIKNFFMWIFGFVTYIQSQLYVRNVIYSTFVLVCIIGASVSEPLINVVNVRRVCMYVCVVRHSVNI